MNTLAIHHEKYHDDHSRSLVLACELSEHVITAAYYDLSLSRMTARSVAVVEGLTAEEAAAELSKFIFMTMREYGISAQCLQKIGVCAPIGVSGAIEEQLDPTDIFLRPDTEIIVIPFVSARTDGRTAAFLASVPFEEGTLAVRLAKSLDLAYFAGGKLFIASMPLIGAFDSSALESGMPCEYGAIDEVSREDNGTVCYSVIGDSDSEGIAASAAVDVVRIMRDTGILDEDGIMTDRDQFYIGEDYYISQKDVRAVQSDKASLAAALECMLKRYGAPKKLYLSGEVLASKGMQSLTELGVFPDGMAQNAVFSRNASESGVLSCLEDAQKLEALERLIYFAEDVTEDILTDFDDIYISKLQF